MIFCDSSEHRYLPSNLRAEPCGLERHTGADLMITPWKAPAYSEALIRQHLRRDAVLVQLKRGSDLIASRFDERLYAQLVRMKEWVDRPTLLFIGVAEPSTDGMLLIDGRPLQQPALYQVFLSICATWQDKGGYWEQIPSDAWLRLWCDMWLRRITKGERRRIVPRQERSDLFLQTPEEATISSFPGIGVELAHNMWSDLSERAEQRLIQALVWMTGPDGLNVRGWGKGRIAACRQHLGLEDYEEISVSISERRTDERAI